MLSRQLARVERIAATPKGLGVKHDAEGILRILPEFELGLTDVEGFSRLMVNRACPIGAISIEEIECYVVAA